MTRQPAIAGAPCNVGVPGGSARAADPARLLDALAAQGYDGTDLGPPQYLAGDGDDLTARLRRWRLGLAGGWVGLGEAASEEQLQAVLAACDAGATARPDLPPPRPTLAAPPAPGGCIATPAAPDRATWSTLVAEVDRAARRCADRGHPPVLHPHAGTLVETPAQTERMLADTDVDLCFDSGHVLLGGGEPAATLRSWRDRVAHVHLKDADAGIAAELRRQQEPVDVVWRTPVFCELGTGDVDVPVLLDELDGWGGWVVVEQDAAPRTDADVDAALAAQGRNRAYLAARGW